MALAGLGILKLWEIFTSSLAQLAQPGEKVGENNYAHRSMHGSSINMTVIRLESALDGGTGASKTSMFFLLVQTAQRKMLALTRQI
jgi:hypothetical protein